MMALPNPPGFCIFCYKSKAVSTKNGENKQNIIKFAKFVRRWGKSKATFEFIERILTEKLLDCCTKCAFIIEDFCECYNQLKILGLKLDFLLDTLAEKINYANKVPARWIHVSKILEETFLNQSDNKAEGHQREIRKFRQNIVKTVQQRKAQSQPRVMLNKNFNENDEVSHKPKSYSRTLQRQQKYLPDNSHDNINSETPNENNSFNETNLHNCNKICPKCGKKLKSIDGLKIHLEHHKDQSEWKYPCRLCPKRFTTQVNLNVHMRSHTGERPFKCRYCGIKFRYRNELTKHLKVKHANAKGVQKELKRRWFNKPSSDESSVPKDPPDENKVQSQTVNIIEEDVYDDMSELVEYSEEVESNGNYLSETENIMLGSDPGYEDQCIVPTTTENIEATANFQDPQIQIKVEHQVGFDESPKNIHSKKPSKRNYKTLKQSTRKAMRKPSSSKVFECVKCRKKYKTYYCLQIHMKGHTNPRNFKCTNCGKSFVTKFGLQIHMKVHATDKKQFKCKFCGQNYLYKLRLAHHLKEKHGDEKGVKEEIRKKCGKIIELKNTKCTTKTSTTQLETLIKDKKFSYCKDCKKPFRTLQILKAHMNSTLCTKKANTVKELMKCEECGKVFNLDKDLWGHQREVHDIKVCSDCGKQFRKTFNFKVHLEYHKDPKDWKFECEICGKKTVSGCKMNEHKKLHLKKNYKRRNKLVGVKELDNSSSKLKKKSSNVEPDSVLENQQDRTGHNVKCEDCQEIFHSDKKLWVHKRNVHEKRVCLECGKQFNTTNKFKLHLEYHKDPIEWQFECKICGKKCVSRGSLKEHMANHSRKNYKPRIKVVKSRSNKSNNITDKNKTNEQQTSVMTQQQSRYSLRKDHSTNFLTLSEYDSDYGLGEDVGNINGKSFDGKKGSIKDTNKLTDKNISSIKETGKFGDGNETNTKIDKNNDKKLQLNESSVLNENNLLNEKGDCFGDGTLVEFEDLD